MNKQHTLISTIDRIQVVGFGAIAALSLYGIIAEGAWWHVVTLAISAAIVKASVIDIKEEEGGER